MAELELSVEKRSEVGSAPARRLRSKGLIPAVLYGLGQDTITLKVPESEFEDLLRKGGGHQIIYLNLDGQRQPALVKDVQRHPITRRPLAIDFIRIDLSKPVTVSVPLQIVGTPEEDLPSEANITLATHEVQIRGLPTNVPPVIEVDVAPLRLDRPVTIADLPKGDYEYLQPEDTPVAIVTLPKRVLMALEQAAEGEAPAEGEAEAAPEAPAEAPAQPEEQPPAETEEEQS